MEGKAKHESRNQCCVKTEVDMSETNAKYD